MIPDLIYYVCIAKGTTVLAELNSKDLTLDAIAAKCLEHTPPLHATFTHTVRSKTYTFLIDDSFIYFAIFDERLGKSEGLAFLTSVKDAFGGVFKGETKLENLTHLCFQEDLNPVFRRLLDPDLDRFGRPTRQRIDQIDVQPCGSGPIRERPKLNMVKNRLPGELKIGRENGVKENGENEGNGTELGRKFPQMLHRSGGLHGADLTGHQRAKRVWKKQVWVVLSLDLIICLILFGVWLWVCRGLECIES